MDVLNFISWIKSGRQVTTVDPAKTLLPLGLKDPKRDDGYLSGAVSAQDFINQVVSCVPASSGIVIEGTGTASSLRCGATNIASGNCSTVFGSTNLAGQNYSGTLSGVGNASFGLESSILGGAMNTIGTNTASGYYSCLNKVCPSNGTISLYGDFSAYVGKQFTYSNYYNYNVVSGTVASATYSGGYTTLTGIPTPYPSNLFSGNVGKFPQEVTAAAFPIGYSVIGGGLSNYMTATTQSTVYATIAGGSGHVLDGSLGGTIGGGTCSYMYNSCNSTIAGGRRHNISNNSHFGIVGGGTNNSIRNFSCFSLVGGGRFNGINSSTDAAILGGCSNCVTSGGSGVMIGTRNIVSGAVSMIANGCVNIASGNFAFTGSGYYNVASGTYSFIGSGRQNVVACCDTAVVTGFNNRVCGNSSGIFGGLNNLVTNVCSFVIGQGITSDRDNTLFANNLSLKSLPTSSAGLPSGAVWRNGNVLNIV